MRRLALSFLFLVVIACVGARLPPLPPVFPMATAWRTDVGAVLEPPLATDGARVFAATRDGNLRALAVETGEVQWQVGGRPGLLDYGAGWVVVREVDGTVWGIDPTTGSAHWKVESGIKGTLPPVIYRDAVIVGGEGLVALDLGSGRVRWTDAAARMSATPRGWGPWLLSGEADGLRCRDFVTGAVLWTHPTTKPLLAPPAVDRRGNVYLGTADRRMVSLGLESKGDERWTWRLGAAVSFPPAILGDKVVFASHEDVLWALRRGNGHLAWRAALPSRPISGPLLRGDAVLIACYGTRPDETLILEFDGRTGRREGDLRTEGEMRTPPMLVGDRLVVGLAERAVLGLRLAAPEPSPAASPGPSPSPSPSPAAASANNAPHP